MPRTWPRVSAFVLHEILVLPDSSAMAMELAWRFQLVIDHAAHRHHRARLALTGGSSAKLYNALASQRIDWGNVELFWTDERAVPPDHPESNYRAARENLLDFIDIPHEHVHRMPTDMKDLEDAARFYEMQLPASLDLVHLGMGADGHVASLFPGHSLLEERIRLVRAIEDAPKPPPRRLTLTLPALQRACSIVLTVTGAEKAAVFSEIVIDPASLLPAGLAVRGDPTTILLADDMAASQWSPASPVGSAPSR
jgi:6-phosphogluconolactonase